MKVCVHQPIATLIQTMPVYKTRTKKSPKPQVTCARFLVGPQGRVSRESCTQGLEAFLQDTIGPLLVQLLHASVLNFGGDIESTARRGGEGGRFIDKGEEKSCRIEEDVDAE